MRPDLLPRPGAVHRRRLVEVPRDLLQSGEVEDEVEAERPPDGGDRERRHRPRRVAEPARRGHADLGERGVEQAQAGRVEPDPDQRHDRGRQDVRREERQAEEPPAACRPGWRAGPAGSARITSGGVVRMVNHSVCHSDDQKSALLQRLRVVAQPGGAVQARLDQAGVGEAQHQAVQGRPDDEHQVQEQERREEGRRRPALRRRPPSWRGRRDAAGRGVGLCGCLRGHWVPPGTRGRAVRAVTRCRRAARGCRASGRWPAVGSTRPPGRQRWRSR